MQAIAGIEVLCPKCGRGYRLGVGGTVVGCDACVGGGKKVTLGAGQVFAVDVERGTVALVVRAKGG